MDKTGNDDHFEKFLAVVGKRIKEIRESKGLTQAEMSQEPFPFERRYWQRIEAGEVNITLKTLYLIAEKLDVAINDIFK